MGTPSPQQGGARETFVRYYMVDWLSTHLHPFSPFSLVIQTLFLTGKWIRSEVKLIMLNGRQLKNLRLSALFVWRMPQLFPHSRPCVDSVHHNSRPLEAPASIIHCSSLLILSSHMPDATAPSVLCGSLMKSQ